MHRNRETSVRKVWVPVAACILLLPVVVVFGVKRALPPERVRALILPRLDKALGRPVAVDRVHVGALPPVARLEGVRVAASAGFEQPTLLALDAIEIRPRLLPLLRRRLVARSITLRRPEVWLEQRADSTWNFAPPVAVHAPATSSQAAPVFDIGVESLHLEGGVLHFWSAPAAIELRSPIAAELRASADRSLRDVRLSGWIAADSVAGGPRGMLRGVRGVRLRLEPRIAANVPDSSATIEALRIGLNAAVFELEGTARRTRGKPEVHLRTRSGDVDLAQLLAVVPRGTVPVRALEASGTLRLDLQVDAEGGNPPVTRGSVQVRDGAVQFEGLPERIAGIALDVQLAGDSLHLRDARATLGGAPFQARGFILEPSVPARTRFDLQLATALDLASIAGFMPLEPGVSLAGRVEADVRARGRSARPDSVYLTGPIRLLNVSVKTPQLLQPLLLNAQCEGAGDVVRIANATVRAGTSEVTLTGTLHPALPPKRPRLQFDARAGKLDLAALLPPPTAASANATGTTGNAARTQAPPLVPPPPPIDVSGRLVAQEVLLSGSTLRGAQLDLRTTAAGLATTVHAEEVRAGDIVLHGVDGEITATAGRGKGTLRATRGKLRVIETTALTGDLDIEGRTITSRNLRGNAYDGALTGGAVLHLDDPAAPRFEFDVRADDVQAGGFLGSVVPFLRQAISGSFDLQSTWKGTGSTPAVVRSSLIANGTGSATGGRLQALPILDELGAALGLESLRKLDYRDLGFHFAVENGRMAVRDLAIRAADADFGIGGSIGLDGGLDLALQVKLSEELSRRYLRGKTLGALGSLFADPSGRLVFDFGVSGQALKPKLALDANATAARAGVSALTQSTLQRLLGSVSLPNIPIPGLPQAGTPTTPATPRDAQREAVDALGRKLGGLLRGDKKSQPDTTKAKP